MAAFAAVVSAGRSATAAASPPAPLPHRSAVEAMRGAAADRITNTGAWHDDALAMAWGHDHRFEHEPIGVVTPAGRAWFEGRVAQPPAEVERILTAVIGGDVAACRSLRGSFSVWAWHEATRTLRVVTDPFARRPVYWASPAGHDSRQHPVPQVVVATEIRQVLAHPTVPRRLDDTVLVATLADLAMPVECTPFVGVSFVPPGSVLTVAPGRTPRVEPWMAWPDEVDHGPSQHEWADRLREVTVEAVRRAIVSDGVDDAVGITVSGGLDSSMVAGMATSLVGSERLRALTMRFPGLPSDETRYQDLMLEATGMAEISVGPQAGFDYWAAICGEVARRAVPISWLQPEIDALMRAGAAAGVRTVVRGVGGDELFAPGSATVVDALVSRRFAAAGQFLGDPPLSAQLRWVLRGARSVAEQAAPPRVRARAELKGLPTWLTPSAETLEALAELVVVEPRGLGLSAAMRRDRWRRFDTDAARSQSDWADASATSAGVAVVDPLLDVDVVAMALTVPESLRWAPGDPRRLQRGVGFPFLPDDVMRRPDKAYMGPATFSHLRAPTVTDVLASLDLAERGLVDAAALAELHRATAVAHDGGDRELPGGPMAVAQLLSVEALVRSVM